MRPNHATTPTIKGDTGRLSGGRPAVSHHRSPLTPRAAHGWTILPVAAGEDTGYRCSVCGEPIPANTIFGVDGETGRIFCGRPTGRTCQEAYERWAEAFQCANPRGYARYVRGMRARRGQHVVSGLEAFTRPGSEATH